MPAVIVTETIQVDDLPGIWSPVQWELTDEERVSELEQQATASLLWSVDVPEAILRMLLDETAVERLYEPPEGYDSAQQGEWDPSLITFGFKRRVHLDTLERSENTLDIIYKLEGAGYWQLTITPDRVSLERI